MGCSVMVFAEESGSIHARREVPRSRRPTLGPDEWPRFGERLTEVAEHVRRQGLRLAYHHHIGTVVETEEEIDHLMEAAGETVGLLLDTGHCVYGGGEPLDVLKRHRGRVRYLHLKDARETELRHVRTSDVSMAEAWKRGVFCPLGEGVVDFPRVIETLRGGGYTGWLIVEQDVVPDEQGRLEPDPSDSARKSRAYLRDKAGV